MKLYIIEVKTKSSTGKISHQCNLLSEFYWENEEVISRTIENLTHCSMSEWDAIRLAIVHKDDLNVSGSFNCSVKLGQ